VIVAYRPDSMAAWQASGGSDHVIVAHRPNSLSVWQASEGSDHVIVAHRPNNMSSATCLFAANFGGYESMLPISSTKTS
jgi:hypothetical protein